MENIMKSIHITKEDGMMEHSKDITFSVKQN